MTTKTELMIDALVEERDRLAKEYQTAQEQIIAVRDIACEGIDDENMIAIFDASVAKLKDECDFVCNNIDNRIQELRNKL